jgi:TatD DNase family protein
MILCDVHAHLDFPEFAGDLDEVLKDAERRGVRFIVDNGVDPEANRRILELARKHPVIRPAFGFYPVHVAEKGLPAVEEEIAWMRKHKPIAIGEVGLDYKIGDDNPHGDVHKDVQREAFRRFIRLAKELDVPVIVHSRKAEDDVLDLLEEEKHNKVVLHCFMGKHAFVERAMKAGYTFSVPVSVVKLEQLQWLVKEVPLGQLLTETDAPYQGPVRGERNVPGNIELSIAKIAEIKGMEPLEVANQLYMNYQRLFL